MAGSFKVRKVTGYNPGYPAGVKKTRKFVVAKRPVKFLSFIVIGFLFFFMSAGCGNTTNTASGDTDMKTNNDTDIAVNETDTATPDNNTPDTNNTDTEQTSDADVYPYNDLGGVAPADLEVADDDSNVCLPDYDDQIAGGKEAPDSDILENDGTVSTPDSDDQLAGDYVPDDIITDNISVPDEDNQLAGDPIPSR